MYKYLSITCVVLFSLFVDLSLNASVRRFTCSVRKRKGIHPERSTSLSELNDYASERKGVLSVRKGILPERNTSLSERKKSRKQNLAVYNRNYHANALNL